MAPAAKRRRKVVEPSDDEDDKPTDNVLTRFLSSSPNTKRSFAHATSRATAPAGSPSPLKGSYRVPNSKLLSSSPGTSPEKPRTRAQRRDKVEEKGKTADLLTLFSQQAQRSKKLDPGNRSRNAALEDIISDPLSEPDDVAYSKTGASSVVGQKAKKRLRGGLQVVEPTPPNASQMFLRPAKPSRPEALNDDLRPWSERFGPVNLDELGVHKKKVADVRRWIDDVLGGRLRQRVLLLKGGAGTGKTTTIRLLAKELDYEILEWKNPTTSFSPGMQSFSTRFEEFLGLGGKIGGLDTDMAEAEGKRNVSDGTRTSRRRIILVEEFPNTFTRSSTALTTFRNTIRSFLAANTPSLATFGRKPLNDPVTPIVMIISETLLTTTSALADSFTAHRLLGPEILTHPGFASIEFNAIAPSLLSKALELVVVKEARKSGRRRTPGPQVLRRLGEIGDIRNAVASLEFLCLKGDQESDWGAKVSFAKPKRGSKDGVPLTQGERESLEQVSQREASLGIFHAVGKVVYNKRDDARPSGDSVELLPGYIAHHSRPKPSQVSVDTLIDETGTDTSTFISALHENYALSCEGITDSPGVLTPIEYINSCIDSLSDSDLLCPSWDSFFGAKGYPIPSFGRDSGSHIVRQDDMAFQVAVRGLLFSLPHPVKRKSSGPPSRGGTDAFKMFYPTSIKLWRAKEEMEGLVDVWSSKLLSGDDNPPRKDLTDGAGIFKRMAQNRSSPLKNRQPPGPITTQDSGTPSSDAVALLSLGSAARREMLLERLPYMAHIARGKKAPVHSLRLRDIERVVSFQGITAPSDDLADDGDDPVLTGEAWATDKPSEEASPRKKKVAIRARADDGSMKSLQVHKLILSDDDIEDD